MVGAVGALLLVACEERPAVPIRGRRGSGYTAKSSPRQTGQGSQPAAGVPSEQKMKLNK
jgi:hypothetical protein